MVNENASWTRGEWTRGEREGGGCERGGGVIEVRQIVPSAVQVIEVASERAGEKFDISTILTTQPTLTFFFVTSSQRPLRPLPLRCDQGQT